MYFVNASCSLGKLTSTNLCFIFYFFAKKLIQIKAWKRGTKEWNCTPEKYCKGIYICPLCLCIPENIKKKKFKDVVSKPKPMVYEYCCYVTIHSTLHYWLSTEETGHISEWEFSIRTVIK